MCIYANSGCNGPVEGECIGLCTLTRRVRAGSPPPDDPIQPVEFSPREIRKDELQFAARCAAWVVVVLVVLGSVHFVARAIQ